MTRNLYLISFRESLRQRAHFAIWFPYADGEIGTLINVVGTPMVGYQLEFERRYNPSKQRQKLEMFQIDQISTRHLKDWTGPSVIESNPTCNVELSATQVTAPGRNENFMAPVNDTTNRRCQEWTMDFVRRLIALEYLDSSAATIVQSKRDLPSHGILGLQFRGEAVQQQDTTQQPPQPQE